MCWPLIVACVLWFVVGRVFFVVWCLLCWCLLFDDCCMLYVVRCLLIVVCRMLIAVCVLSFDMCLCLYVFVIH